jgi:thiosulfate/3-mercaptopyruvate sulfurtransferase
MSGIQMARRTANFHTLQAQQQGDHMANYAHPDSLVSTQWVADHLNDPHVRPVEIILGASPQFGRPAYESKHIPRAIAWDFEKDLQDSVRHDVVDKLGIESLLSRSGIASDTTVLLYSGLNNILATFGFWLLKIYGHADVRLLDGDRQKWLDENRQTTSEAPVVVPAPYQAPEPNWSLRANRDDVLSAIGQANYLLVDARPAEMYSGRDKARAARGGHIPGAINLVARRETNPDGAFIAWRVPTVQADGTFKPAEELRALFHNLGITADKDIITYCVGGGLSTHAWFALTQLLGYRSVREYDRSWAEWGNLEGVPVAE